MSPASGVRVLDGFLPGPTFDALLAALLAPGFPWESSRILTPQAASAAGLAADDNRQQVHGFLLNRRTMRVQSPRIGVVAPALDALGASRWYKVKANLTPRRDRPIAYGLHVDVRQAGATTAILYLNTNDGGTLFEDGTRVASVANRLAVFDAAIPHTGVSCTDAAWRLVLNFNLVLPAESPLLQRACTVSPTTSTSSTPAR